MTDAKALISQVLPIGPVNVGPTERIATAGIGGALLLLGLDRGRAAGTLMAIAGGVLLTRSVTGHCPAYQAFTSGNRMSRRDRFEPGGPEDFARDDFTNAELGGRSRAGGRRTDVAEVLGGPHPDSTRGPTVPHDDLVEEGSEFSFPASDPPSYMGDRAIAR